MNYEKQNFVSGQTLKAEHLNHMEDGIGQLSEEIGEIKDGMTEAVTQTGAVVEVITEAGKQITVEGESYDGGKLVHTNKNLAFHQIGDTESKGVTYKLNDDGTVTASGASTGSSYYYLINPRTSGLEKVIFPAGVYTVTCDFPTQTDGLRVMTWDEAAQKATTFVDGINAKTPVKSFELSEPTLIMIGTYVDSGKSVNGTFSVQIEIGNASTNYVKASRETHDTSYPVVLTAFEGSNVIYEESGNIITASIEGSAGLTRHEVNQMIDAKLKLDVSAYGIPALYLEGNVANMTKDDAVELEYRFGDIVGTCTCKWQGNSSLTFPKKNYTLKFDNAFEAADKWGAQKKYCAKANHNDFTQSRNVVSAKIWGDIVRRRVPANTTLAACPNYGAIDGFPIVIVLNGEFHGVYCFNIPKDGWMMNMGSGTNECILCADYHVPATKFEGEAALDGTDFELEYVTDEDNAGWVLTSLNNLLRACANSDGSDLDTTIATMLDWKSAIDYYIFSALIRNTDGISKNYLLSTYDGVKWFFGAYDMDTVFGNVWNGNAFASPAEGGTFEDIAVENHLFRLIKTHKTAELKQRYEELRATTFSEANIISMFMSFAGQIPRALMDEECRKWPTIPFTSVHTIDSIVNWYRIRCAVIDAEAEAM